MMQLSVYMETRTLRSSNSLTVNMLYNYTHIMGENMTVSSAYFPQLYEEQNEI